MGVSGIVVCLTEFVMFFLVGKVIKLIGHIGIMYAGLVGYSVRFCIYAVITNPWWVLPAEVLQGKLWERGGGGGGVDMYMYMNIEPPQLYWIYLLFTYIFISLQ